MGVFRAAAFFYLFLNFYLFCVSECFPACVGVPHARAKFPRRSEGTGSLGTGVTDSL